MRDVLISIGAVGVNRGSEMLVRGIVNACHDAGIKKVDLTSAAETIEGKDLELYGGRYYCRSFALSLRIATLLEKHIGNNRVTAFLKFIRTCLISVSYKVIIIVGADNFDAKRSKKCDYNYLIDMLGKISRAKLVLYDCSIAAEHINPWFVENMKRCSLITARDPVSCQNIKQYEQNVVYLPDGAFGVEPQKVVYDGLPIGGVGINLSPILAKNKLVVRAYEKLIEYILAETEYPVLLIPHVEEDIEELRRIKRKYRHEARVFLIDDIKLTGPQLKYIISQCRFCVVSRTHASIAAYSQCIPTIVTGYSVKSEGIALDLMGEQGREYVLSLKGIKDDNCLIQKFQFLMEHETVIKELLEQKMSTYIADSKKIGTMVRQILKNT